MNSPIVPSSPKSSFICFTLESGMSIKSSNIETVKPLVELIKSTPTLDKKNAYFIVDNQVVFLENVDFIRWELAEEEIE